MSLVHDKVELVFVPFPIMSHLVAAMEMAKLLIHRDQRISITVLIMKPPTDTKIDSYINNLHNPAIHIIQLPRIEESIEFMKYPETFIARFVESHKSLASETVAKIMESSKNSTRVAGFVIDTMCTSMIDVANEFGVPTYVFFPFCAALLGLMFHFHGKDLKEYEDWNAEISVPMFVEPIPARVLPSAMFSDGSGFFDVAKRFGEIEGIIINTFYELEPHAVTALTYYENVPPIYLAGPILHLSREVIRDRKEHDCSEIMEWLDQQPDSSVIFLCFGSINGYFEKSNQVKEIAIALKNSGQRFLWSLKKAPPKDKMGFPGEDKNYLNEVLPEGFLEHTAGIGKVIGWAPQMAVLSHPSVGGFVSHCGWNSTLESVWHGVPMAAWPLFAEQQTNASQLVKEIGIAVEIKIDYKMNSNVIVGAEKIEVAIKQLMEQKNDMRRKVKAMKEKGRNAIMEGGSSYNHLGRLIQNFMDNLS